MNGPYLRIMFYVAFCAAHRIALTYQRKITQKLKNVCEKLDDLKRNLLYLYMQV